MWVKVVIVWFALFIVEGAEAGVVTTCVPWLVMVPLLDKPLLLVVVPTALILLPR